MFCAHCGEEIKDASAMFCTNCGAALAGTNGENSQYTPCSLPSRYSQFRRSM